MNDIVKREPSPVIVPVNEMAQRAMFDLWMNINEIPINEFIKKARLLAGYFHMKSKEMDYKLAKHIGKLPDIRLVNSLRMCPDNAAVFRTSEIGFAFVHSEIKNCEWINNIRIIDTYRLNEGATMNVTETSFSFSGFPMFGPHGTTYQWEAIRDDAFVMDMTSFNDALVAFAAQYADQSKEKFNP